MSTPQIPWGWMGDAQLTAQEAIYNFDMAGFYTKWVEDIRDSQAKDGSVPDVVPPYCSLYPAGPSFRRIIIKPSIVGDLDYVSASIKTIRGMISSSWKKNGHLLTLDVTLPVNTQGKVSVPKMKLANVMIKEGGKTVWENGSYLEGVAGITGGSEDDEYVTFNIGSGSYSFEISRE